LKLTKNDLPGITLIRVCRFWPGTVGHFRSLSNEFFYFNFGFYEFLPFLTSKHTLIFVKVKIDLIVSSINIPIYW